MDTTVPIILASASPRRRELLAAAGIPFDVVVADVDESVIAGERPDEYVRRVAHMKAQAVSRDRPDALVLGADTTVVIDGDVLAKPADDDEAARMLQRLSGREHVVLTGVAAISPMGESEAVAATRVWMRALTDAEIREYVRSGEPRDKAGAYAIQGLASRFISRIEGEYANVVGLPIAVVDSLLRELRVVS